MKVRFILSSGILLLFAVLAGGSFDKMISIFWIFLGVLLIVIIGVVIQTIVESKNKKKRLKMIQQDESTYDEFDRSVNFGNDRCMFYFDSAKKQVMIMKVTTEGIQKAFVDEFEFSEKDFCLQNDPYFCFYDAKNRLLLCGNYENMNIKFVKKNIATENKHKDITPRNYIKEKLIRYSLSSDSLVPEYVYILIDESHGMISIIRKGEISSIFNYINSNSISHKTGEKSFISYSSIGNYCFIMDDFFKVLVIITSSSYELFNYSDIIDVSYEENGNQLYSKSAMRTVGGALVGGALMGGAGAVVGGLSGATQKNMEIKTMDIKILLRSTRKTTCVLSFNDSKRVLKTKTVMDNNLYERYQKNVNMAKDLLSVIIDKGKQQKSPSFDIIKTDKQLSIADELAKLAKLKSDGILTEEEFNTQKAKLLNL